MRITQNPYGQTPNYYGSNKACHPSEKFSALPSRKQFKAVEDLVDFANGNNNPGDKLTNLASRLGVRSAAHLSVGIIDASDNLNKAYAQSPLQELSDALGLRPDDIDCTLGKYVAELAGNTRPGNNGSGGGIT